MSQQPSGKFDTFFAWIYNHEKEIIGAGFLIDWREIATCAHVVREALGLESTPASAPKDDVILSFPFLKHDKFSADVLAEGWDKEKDIAILRLNDDLPEKARPAKLSSGKVENHSFSVYGFPGKTDKGVSAYGVIKDKREHGLVQLESNSLKGYAVQGGFSGSPVFDEKLKKVVGMVATSDKSVRVASMIPIEIVLNRYDQTGRKFGSDAKQQTDTRNISECVMSTATTEYIAERKKTKTYQEQIVIFKQYKIEHKFGELQAIFPELPKADDEHHILLIKFTSNFPEITAVMTNSYQNVCFDIKINELSKHLFVFIKTTPKLLHISSPNGGYQLGDGHTIHATIDVTYQVKDAREFWLSADDPLAMFQRAITNEARKYFFGITSGYLIRRHRDSKGDLESYIDEHQINDFEIKKIKDSLERDIKEGCTSSRIEITKVYADVQLSQSLSKHLQRLHERIYKHGGIMEAHYCLQQAALYRKQVDEQINSDKTFYPFKLKDVIFSLDTELIEHFYNLPWTDAIQKSA